MQTNPNWIQIQLGENIPYLQCTANTDYLQQNWFQEIKIFEEM
jgi:hypothetical protein